MTDAPPRDLCGVALIILKKNGIRFEKHGASHDVYYSPITNKRFTVPRHSSKEISVGTAKNIFKISGIKGV